MMRRFVVLGVFVCLCATASASVWYVDKDNTGAQDGTSWDTAFSTIQQGIDAAFDLGTVDAEVWVAEGVYNEARTSVVHPAPDDVNTGSVVLKEGAAVYGGFIGIGPGGNETERTQRNWTARNWTAHVTTLDGSTVRNGKPAYYVAVGLTLNGGHLSTATCKTPQIG